VISNGYHAQLASASEPSGILSSQSSIYAVIEFENTMLSESTLVSFSTLEVSITPRDVAIEFENNMAIHAATNTIFNNPEPFLTSIFHHHHDHRGMLQLEFENTMAMHTATYTTKSTLWTPPYTVANLREMFLLS
jgi:hypothetical protein